MMISVIWLSYIIILSFSFTSIEAACYYPNGSIAPNDTPCRDDTAESTCCGQGYACLSNGICQATGSELQKDGATELVRGSCTDRSWRSSSCPLFCINPESDNVGGGIGVARCQGTAQELYYCINAVQDQVNCTAKQNVLFFHQPATAITTIGVNPTTSVASASRKTRITTSEISTSTASLAVTSVATSGPSRLPSQDPITTASAAQSPTSSLENQPDAASDPSVTIGVAVGASIGCLALGASGVWLFFFLRRRGAREQIVEDRASSYAPQHRIPPSHQVYEAWRPTVGYNHHLRPQELPAGEHNAR